MKRAVSISIGSSQRNKATQVELLGEIVSIERIGTDGDMEKAARLFCDLDGKVDAFGLGGTDLGFCIDGKFHVLHSIRSMVESVRKTPLVDGNGLKILLESRAAQVLNEKLPSTIKPAKAFFASAVDRWGLAESFRQASYDCIYGDMMFALGLPVAVHSITTMRLLAAILIPIVSNLPFKWIYPTGESQNKRTPKWEKYFHWADVIAGDCHYLHRYMPDGMQGKIIVTNTTTPNDRDFFRQTGAYALLTTTPILDGRSFGTNMMEAALVAVTGWKNPIDYTQNSEYLSHLKKTIESVDLQPQFQILNP
ncbi:MAG: quinate 5-dehydrogenase [Leptolinea sp.]|nr:quinate 5-dehydrogenase [Leptolinea sp.]